MLSVSLDDMITLKNVTKRFGRMKAVDDLSLSIEKGEVVGFLGPNGAGKTTTLRMMAGFLVPDKGTVLIDGIDVEREPTLAQRKIGYLPENNPLYKTMHVGEFLDLAVRLHGVIPTSRESSIDSVVRSVGIAEVFYRPIGELSKGYRQRVGIAAALVHKPDIIIMDEPAEGLDPNQRDEIRHLIKDLAKERTVILSTHVMQEASAVCSRLIIIQNGKIVADGGRDEVARLSSDNRKLIVDIEGNGIEAAIRSLIGGGSISVLSRKGNRISLELSLKRDQEICPDLSRIAWQNKWVFWGVHEEERGLEDVFRSLTKGE